MVQSYVRWFFVKVLRHVVKVCPELRDGPDGGLLLDSRDSFERAKQMSPRVNQTAHEQKSSSYEVKLTKADVSIEKAKKAVMGSTLDMEKIGNSILSKASSIAREQSKIYDELSVMHKT